jgi:hypothetical protein
VIWVTRVIASERRGRGHRAGNFLLHLFAQRRRPTRLLILDLAGFHSGGHGGKRYLYGGVMLGHSPFMGPPAHSLGLAAIAVQEARFPAQPFPWLFCTDGEPG